MSHHETWAIAVDVATGEYRELDTSLLAAVHDAVGELMTVKREIFSLFEGMNGSAICRLCRGECCQSGCYHFTVIDLVAYLATGRELFTPRFDAGVCPFLGDEGCMMAPDYRPYNCVTFVCDRIDAGMDPFERTRFADLSARLIGLYQKFESLFANRFVYGILNNGTRFIEGRSKGILRS